MTFLPRLKMNNQEVLICGIAKADLSKFDKNDDVTFNFC